jgi:hypothetical protein
MQLARSLGAAAAPLLCAISTPCFVYYQIATTHQGCGRDAVFNLRFEFLLEFLGSVERGVFFSCVNHQDVYYFLVWSDGEGDTVGKSTRTYYAAEFFHRLLWWQVFVGDNLIKRSAGYCWKLCEINNAI